MPDQSSENAYQAALVTRDRALQARQESIDVLRRLLSQMEDDPLVQKARANLDKILENPEVITDEVFNNIMSKTGEVLDANYDQQVQQVLAAARSKGVSGPALQLTLQRAKEARATAIASAYRDAIIERASTGLQTSLDAINQTSSLLNNLFNQQRVVTEDLVNTMQTVVEEPFRNVGPAELPQAAAPSGAGQWRPITANYPTESPFSKETVQAFNPATGKVEWVTPEMKAQLDAQNQAYWDTRNQRAREADAEAERQYQQWKAQNLAGGERPAVTPMPQTVVQPSKTPTGETITLPISQFQGGGTTAPVSGMAGVGSDLISNLKSAATSGVSQIQNAVTGAMSGLTGLGNTIAQNFQSALKAPTSVQTQYTTIPGTNIETGAANLPGGAAQAASLGKQLVQQYGSKAVIGTSSGPGVRYDTTSAGSGKGVTGVYGQTPAGGAAAAARAEGAASSAAAAAQRAADEARYKAALELSAKGLGTGAGAWGLLPPVAGPAGAGAAGAGGGGAGWWDAAKKAATAGFTGLGAAFAGMFK